MSAFAFWNPDALPFTIVWEAWSSFVVGLAAVGGAVWIGLRQAGIAKRQADISAKQADILERQVGIAARQVDLENAKLRADLYDRRMAVCSGFEEYVMAIAQSDGAVTNAERERFHEAWAASRYLFGPEVYQVGQQLSNTALALRQAVSHLDRLPDEQGQQRRDDLIDAITSRHDRLAAIHREFQVMIEAYLGMGEVRAAVAVAD